MTSIRSYDTNHESPLVDRKINAQVLKPAGSLRNYGILQQDHIWIKIMQWNQPTNDQAIGWANKCFAEGDPVQQCQDCCCITAACKQYNCTLVIKQNLHNMMRQKSDPQSSAESLHHDTHMCGRLLKAATCFSFEITINSSLTALRPKFTSCCKPLDCSWLNQAIDSIQSLFGI